MGRKSLKNVSLGVWFLIICFTSNLLSKTKQIRLQPQMNNNSFTILMIIHDLCTSHPGISANRSAVDSFTGIPSMHLIQRRLYAPIMKTNNAPRKFH